MAHKPMIPSMTLLRALADHSYTLRPTHSPACLLRRRCIPQPHLSRSYAAPADYTTTKLSPEFKHRRSKDGELQPKPLNRPLGLPYPPQPGQNTGRDTRSAAQKRDDFSSYSKHRERRATLLSDVFERNYYRDIGNLGKVHQGKSMLAPATPFKASLAYYFPNLEGISLVPGMGYRDTTPVLRGRVSVVRVLNTEWAHGQVETFTGAKENAALHELMDAYEPARGLAQFVTVNVEENWLKAAMVRLFFYRLRRQMPEHEHRTYFLNRRGLTDAIRDAMGMWNSKVGYVYLVDPHCRIRWAGNGNARAEEKESLVRCLRRLVDEARGVQRSRLKWEEPKVPSGDAPKATREKEHALA